MKKPYLAIPNLDVNTPTVNILKELNYYSFEERLFDLSTLFKDNLDKDLSRAIGTPVYKNVIHGYKKSGARQTHPTFNGIYKLAPIDIYMGKIPKINQEEISSRFDTLVNNPIFKHSFELVILAPLNNFAEDSDIKAIDPIAFAYFDEGEHSRITYLITLSQWI